MECLIMIIDGFEQLTLLDYPGHLACMIFTRGCNFKCPYCQNSSLIRYNKDPGKFSEEEILEFLKSRQGKLEGIVISGGEPTIQKGFVEYDGWKFYTSDNRNYVKFESPDGIVGTFIKDCENY